MASAHLDICKGSIGSSALWFDLKVQKCTHPSIVLALTLVMQPEILPLEIFYFTFNLYLSTNSLSNCEELTF